MIEDHRGAVAGTHEIDQVVQLEVIEPGVVGQPTLPKTPYAAAKRAISGQIWFGGPRNAIGLGVVGACQVVANAAEASSGGGIVGIKDLVEIVEAEVGSGHDAANHLTAGLVGSIGNESGLAHGCHRVGVGATVCSAAFNKDGGVHLVAIAEVGEEVVEPVGQPSLWWPKVVMRIDNPGCGVDDVFDDKIKPLLRTGCGHVHIPVLAASAPWRRWRSSGVACSH